MIQKLSNLTAFAIGYITAPTPDVILSTTFPVSQPVVDEIAKAVTGLIITVASRWIFGKIDQAAKRRKAPKRTYNKPEPPPESITLKTPVFENETQNSK